MAAKQLKKPLRVGGNVNCICDDVDINIAAREILTVGGLLNAGQVYTHLKESL